MKKLIFLLFLVNQLYAQEFPQFGNLKPGSYAVGYKTIRTIDYTRNYDGIGRPMQIYLWYPASSNTSTMKYGDYFEDVGYDLGKPEQAEKIKQALIEELKKGALFPSFPNGIEEADFQTILNTNIPVFKNAEPATGKFPVLLHTHANGVITQSILLEYLASYGYVVMSYSMIGTSPVHYNRGEHTPLALLTGAEDAAFALAQAHQLPFADTQQTAMIGMLAQNGLSLQFKEMSLKAIAGLDPDWNEASMKTLPYYDIKKIRIPILELINTDFADQNTTFLDSLPFSNRYIVRFQHFPHADFYPFPKIAKPESSRKHLNYEIMAQYCLHFLNAVLKADKVSEQFLLNSPAKNSLPADFLSIQKKEAQPSVPTEAEFLAWLRYGEMEKVREARQTAGKEFITQQNLFSVIIFLNRDQEPHAYEALRLYMDVFPSDIRITNMLNQHGYAFLQQKQLNKALEVFQLFIKQFPDSPYAYDGLADVYHAMGDKEKTLLYSQKVLTLLDSANLPPAQRNALKASAEEKIKQVSN